MKYYGMDIHKRYSVYTVVDEQGKVLDQGRIANHRQALAQMVGEDGPAKLVMEATCNWYYLYDLLEGMVDEVCLAHPLRTKAIASARVKTDKVDATTLAYLLRADLIPKSYIPPREVRELRELLRQRASLVRLATQVKNRVHALLTKNGILQPFSDLFGRGGGQWLSRLNLRPVYGQALEAHLRILDFLLREIDQYDREIDRQAKDDPGVKLLTTVPGIGKYTAMLILAEIGDVHRFPDAKHLVSYSGLAPSVHSSGGSTRYGPITKQGSAWLRWIMVQAAHVAARQPGPWQDFYQRIACRQGKGTAAVALARKMLRVCYYLLKEEEVFRR